MLSHFLNLLRTTLGVSILLLALPAITLISAGIAYLVTSSNNGASLAVNTAGPNGIQGLMDQLPAGLFPAAVSAMQTEDVPETYYIIPTTVDGTAYRTENSDHKFAAKFTPGGITLSAGEGSPWDWSLRAASYGRQGSLRPLADSWPAAAGNRVEYVHANGLTEWYVNGPMGLQQGFTIPDSLAGGEGLVEVRVALSGSVTAEVEQNGQAAILRDAGGPGRLRYAGLYVYDDDGRRLDAYFEAVSGGWSILVDDTGAHYPITIDPFLQRGQLTDSGGSGNDEFGYSIAVDGDTVVVGAPKDNNSQGAAFVFTKPSGGLWADTSSGAKLRRNGFFRKDNDEMGYSVAIDGDNVAVGVPGAKFSLVLGTPPFNIGEIDIFRRSRCGGSSGWSDCDEHSRFTDLGPKLEARIGTSVSISGSVLVAGGLSESENRGTVYIYTSAGGGGNNDADARLQSPDRSKGDRFGKSVAIDGDVVVVGAHREDHNGTNDSGAAYVFTKPTAGWSGTINTASKLTAGDKDADDALGWSAAMDGDVVVVGAIDDDASATVTNSGSVYVFVKPTSGWANGTHTAKLTASDGLTDDQFGKSVGISGDTIVVGTQSDDGSGGADADYGSVYIFNKPSSGWADASAPATLTAGDGEVNDEFGFAVAISGGTIAVGARMDDPKGDNSGSAYVFTLNVPPTATDDSPVVNVNGDIDIDILANDFDPDNTLPDDMTITIVTQPSYGTLTFNDTNKTYGYTHNGSEDNSDSFTYEINDGHDDSASATVSIKINGAPVARTDTDSISDVSEGGSVEIDLLANYFDVDNTLPDDMTITILTQPSYGTLTFNNDTNKTYRYTHNGSEDHTDSFTYKISDGYAESNTATLNISVTPVNDAPVPAGDTRTIAKSERYSK